jgi:DNA replication and repair protein RecF
MAIQKIEIQHLRNLNKVSFQPHAGLNFIFGANGSGKTSLLEAIHCLGRGKSFRTHKTNQLINKNSDSFLVVATIQQQNHKSVLGIQRVTGQSYIRLDGQNVVRASELSETLPIAVLDTGLHKLIEEGPDQRRRFLDWGVFHVKQHFSHVWNQYRRSLVQRNAALRAGWSRQAIAHWDQLLIESGILLDAARREYVDELKEYIVDGLRHFPAIVDVKLQYQQGWRQGSSFEEYLATQFESDKDRGFTQFGPHRADIRLLIDGQDVKAYLSHGQQKILVANLILAQCRQVTAQGQSPVILVDDLPAELDMPTRKKLLERLEDTQAQVFITATDSQHFEIDYSQYGMFHVEHGVVKHSNFTKK